MPNSEDMKDKGRKMIVTTVKRRMAASWRSLFASMRWMFWGIRDFRKGLIWIWVWLGDRDTGMSGTHIDSEICCASVHLFEGGNALFRQLYTFV